MFHGVIIRSKVRNGNCFCSILNLYKTCFLQQCTKRGFMQTDFNLSLRLLLILFKEFGSVHTDHLSFTYASALATSFCQVGIYLGKGTVPIVWQFSLITWLFILLFSELQLIFICLLIVLNYILTNYVLNI